MKVKTAVDRDEDGDDAMANQQCAVTDAFPIKVIIASRPPILACHHLRAVRSNYILTSVGVRYAVCVPAPYRPRREDIGMTGALMPSQRCRTDVSAEGRGSRASDIGLINRQTLSRPTASDVNRLAYGLGRTARSRSTRSIFPFVRNASIICLVVKLPE